MTQEKPFDEMTNEELKAALDTAGIPYRSDDRKADLIARLDGTHPDHQTGGDDPVAVNPADEEKPAAAPTTETVPGGRYINEAGQTVNAEGEVIK